MVGPTFDVTMMVPVGEDDNTFHASAFDTNGDDTGIPLGSAVPITIAIIPDPPPIGEVCRNRSMAKRSWPEVIFFVRALGSDNGLLKEIRFFRDGELVFVEEPFSGIVVGIVPIPTAGTTVTVGVQSRRCP